jgi:hypothetical protein
MILLVFLVFLVFFVVGSCCRNVVGIAVCFRGEAHVAVVKAGAARAEDVATLCHDKVLHIDEFAAALTKFLFVHIFPGEIFWWSRIEGGPADFLSRG